MLFKSEYNKLPVKPSVPCTIILTRVSPRKFDPHDNLRMAFKPLVDIIADTLIPGLRKGIADGDERLTWVYRQEKGIPKQYQIKVEFHEG